MVWLVIKLLIQLLKSQIKDKKHLKILQRQKYEEKDIYLQKKAANYWWINGISKNGKFDW